MRFALLISLYVAGSAAASEHPGNVFLEGENVHVEIPPEWKAWHAIDIDRNEVAAGTSQEGRAKLGQLPVGYFEIREVDGPGRITAAVVSKTTASDDTPIAIDAAMSWFYAEPERIRGASKLCRLAGVKWVRDRSAWPELETARGTWANETRYERAMRIQREEGLKVLQVNHVSPSWATQNQSHFPDDLRDVYNYYRGLAKRWKNLADAIEPWNEPDLGLFGGHTGCEIASFQKAAYLGLKAGDPNKPVCSVSFFSDRPETLDEFTANESFPYFDQYHLHHYFGLPAYPRAYARHRAASGGRPLWTTEFNLTINWADEKTHEPSEQDLRVQGYRVAKVFSGALHEGSQKAFYFILGHYVERTLQYGILHLDLTPRPAYVAFAAVGRLLNAAKPIGRVDLGDDKLRAFVFRTVVDGADRETLVAWSETHETRVQIEGMEKLYDYLGRERRLRRRVNLTRAPVFIILPSGGSQKLQIKPAPEKPPALKGEPNNVVLQIIGTPDWKQSAFILDDSTQLRLAAYNFGDQPVTGQLSVEGALGAPATLEVAPGDRVVHRINALGAGAITARLSLADGTDAKVFARTAPLEGDRKPQ
jgi:hypothetical protein